MTHPSEDYDVRYNLMHYRNSEEGYHSHETILPECGQLVKRQIAKNYHYDAEFVRKLTEVTHPQHDTAWDTVERLVRSIIRKQNFTPIYDLSIDEDDLLQVALTEISASLQIFRYRCRINSWIHQVTLNSLRRGNRDRNALCRKGHTLTLDDSVVDSRDTVTEQVYWRNLLKEIIDFLNIQTDKRLVAIFYMGLIEEHRLVDIANHFNLSIARTHTLLNKTRNLLRDHPLLREYALELGLYLADAELPQDNV